MGLAVSISELAGRNMWKYCPQKCLGVEACPQYGADAADMSL